MLRFLPWKMIVRRAARAWGIADPALWLARLRKFSQPSEVQEPIELLRAGVHFHARGVINTKAIQHNLDWVWPYWVERQFDPRDESFIPRAFSFSHINLTHRNWTAVGLPELDIYPLVDPRGLVTPLHDGWSLDFWLQGANGDTLLPSRLPDEAVRQVCHTGSELTVETRMTSAPLQLNQRARVVIVDDQPELEIELQADSPHGGRLAVSVRPSNPEGVQFVDSVRVLPDGRGWNVNGETDIRMDRAASRHLASDYGRGDVLHQVTADDSAVECDSDSTFRCDHGMATAASVFDFSGHDTALTVRIPLAAELKSQGRPHEFRPSVTWADVTAQSSALSVPDKQIASIHDAALQTLLLLSADEIVPGPYTYRRFWFRDACLMLHPLLCLGHVDRVRRILDRFPGRQLRDGYFRSQEGEWDSNGQVLWILNRFRRLAHERLSDKLLQTLDPAVNWLDRKRTADDAEARHAGLLPAGFSAEHLGPNDYYYWDDFWSVAGLQAAAEIWQDHGDSSRAERAEGIAERLRSAIDRSLDRMPQTMSRGGIPASPYRRMDSGAIGSLVADYPLQLTAADDSRIRKTAEALLRNHCHRGGFFQDMIHSGINAYLTLDLAQTFLRQGDDRWRNLMQSVADLASPTGQWPEAIHPRTLGGCMGDGQHGWAAAEWLMMVRNCFVREEPDRLVIGSGLFREWFDQDEDLAYGPTLTPWGRISIRVIQPHSHPMLVMDAHWHSAPPRVDVRIPGFAEIPDVSTESAVPLTVTEGDPAGRSSAPHHPQEKAVR